MPVTVSKQILHEIGRIAVLQSQIEGQMAVFISELLYLDEQRGNVLTAKLSFRLLIEILESLLYEEFGINHNHFKAFEALRDEMKRREQQRNEIVHSMWSFGSTFGPDSATRVKVVRRKSGIATREAYPVSLASLKDVAEAMDRLGVKLGNLRVRVCHYEAGARKLRS